MKTQEEIMELLKQENKKWDEFNQLTKEYGYDSLSDELKRYYNTAYDRKVILEWLLGIR